MLRKHHILRTLAFVALMLTLALGANAQSRDIKSRIAASGNVTIDAPEGLDRRSNNELGRPQSSQSSATAKDNKKTDKKEEPKADKDNKDSKKDEVEKDDEKDKEKDKEKEKEKELTKPRQPKRPTSVSQQTIQSRSVGYRIQAYNDRSKASVQQRAREIALKFPQYRTYISYKAPAWRLRIGDFKSRGEAQNALRKIKGVFPSYARQMVIIKDHINIWGND